MSIFGALRSGVSGLYSFSQAMGIISDNISNANTVGYKRVGARFSNFVINQSNDSFYTPGGTRIRSVRENNEQGLLVRSEATTDIAISGKGFFVVTSRVSMDPITGEWVNSGQVHYTRSGQFRPDKDGNLRNADGYYLLSWPPDDTRSQSNLIPTFRETNRVDALRAVNVARSIFSPIATTQIDLGVTLNAGQVPTATAAGGAAPTYPPGTYHYELTTPIIDHQGRQDTLTLRYVKIDPNTWQVHGLLDNAAFVTGATINYDNREFSQLGSVRTAGNPQGSGVTDADTFLIGTLTFDARGKLITVTTSGADVQVRNPVAGAITQSADAALTIFIDPDGLDSSATPPIAGDRLAIDIDFGTLNTSNGHSHFQQRISTTKNLDQNGRAYSSLTGVSFNPSGELGATFANGESRIIAKVPVATFTNENGLRSKTGNVFLETVTSGQVLLREGSTGGAGVVVGSSLEQSKTDIGSEFSDMIIVQRLYVSNTKVISTSDQMLEELLRAKR